MRIQCPNCAGINAVDDNDLGLAVECGHCMQAVQVPEERFAPGVVIDDFIIERLLGKGGMGVVFKAYQISLDRHVALKILMLQGAVKEDAIIDFIREARASARLHHSNVVQAYAVGQSEGVYYLAMELVDGQTVKDVLEANRKLGVEESIDIIRQVALALGYAWREQKLVHRDIKPDNIMLVNDTTAKLMDLGLSRFANDKLSREEDEDEVMGTPQYISPEQLLGTEMDFRGDLYSLGATFYHMIIGHFAFTGPNVTEIARKHLQEPLTPPHKLDPTIPIGVSMVITKMMAKHPDDRYGSMDAFIAALDEAKAAMTHTSSHKADRKTLIKPKATQSAAPVEQFAARKPVGNATHATRRQGAAPSVSGRHGAAKLPSAKYTAEAGLGGMKAGVILSIVICLGLLGFVLSR